MDSVTTENREVLEKIYGLRFPEEFYDFVALYNAHEKLFEDASLEVWLNGPFDILKNPAVVDAQHSLWDARYYDDPPEFLTFAWGGCDGLHWGLYFDDPTDVTYHVAYFYSKDAFEICTAGSSMLDFFRLKIEESHVQCEEYIEEGENDFEEQLEALARLRAVFPSHKTGDRPEIGSNYTDKYETCVRQPVARTRDEIGIVVPGDKYVPLSGTDVLCSRNDRFSEHEVKEWQQEAMELLDKGFPGAALKLGKDLWIFRKYQAVSYSLLDAAYAALDRPLLRTMLADAKAYRAHCDAEQKRPRAKS